MSAVGVLALTMRFEIIDCAECHIQFGVLEDTLNRWRGNGQNFHCPNGHVNVYRETEVQKLRKELEREKQSKEWHQKNAASEREARERTERRLVARKAANTRLRNRVKNGVCPCCSRTFINLQDHMKTKHPEFQPDDKE